MADSLYIAFYLFFLYLFPLKKSCISDRHSSSSTPLTTVALGWKAFGANLR